MGPIEDLGDEVRALKDVDFIKLLAGKSPARLALADEDADVGALALADIDRGDVAAPVPVLVRPTFARMPVSKALGDGRIAKIHFDRGTHVSKRPRALTECRLHDKCRCDRFLDDFKSGTRGIAWMFAWHEAGGAIVGRGMALEHRHCEVLDAAVDDWARRLLIG